MTALSSWRVLVGCAGIVVLLAIATAVRTAWAMVNDGEVSVLRVLPLVVGGLLLLIASVRLLLKRPMRGKTYIAAALAMMMGVVSIPGFNLSICLWCAAFVSICGAALTIVSRREAAHTTSN